MNVWFVSIIYLSLQCVLRCLFAYRLKPIAGEFITKPH